MSADQPTILYPFRKRDPLTGKWYRARWNASLAEIEASGGDWVADGPPVEFRSLGATSNFQPYRPATPRHEALHLHPQRDSPATVDTLERFLAGVFLRRYATYCVRRRRYAQAQGAAELHLELRHG